MAGESRSAALAAGGPIPAAETAIDHHNTAAYAAPAGSPSTAAAATTGRGAVGGDATDEQQQRRVPQQQRGPEYYRTTVFVGGVNEQISESDLEQLFSYCGHVVHVRIITGKLYVLLSQPFVFVCARSCVCVCTFFF